MSKNIKKVLFLVENLPLPLDRRVWMEATTLREAGYTVSIICPKGKNYERSYEFLDGIHIYRHWLPEEKSSAFGYSREYSIALISQLFLAIRIKIKHGFNIIHACNPPDLMFLIALFFKIFFRTKFIFDHHDLSPELYIDKFGKKDFFYKLLLLMEKITFALSDHTIATNESYKQIAIERGKKSPNDITIVRSAPNTQKFKKVSPDHSLKRGFRYLVGYVGVMAEADGVDQLIKAAYEIIIKLNRKDIGFCLMGKGPSFESLKKLALDLNISHSVEFTGRISDEELLKRLSTCDLGVTPDPKTPFNDRSTMNKTLEYMSVGLAQVQYDLLEGRRSALEAALYSEPNNPTALAHKIIEAIDDSELRAKMGAYGRSRMENELGWEHQAQHLLSAYTKL